MRIRLRDGAIAAHCKRLDISRDELARRMGMSSAAAYRVDAERGDPSPRFIAGLIQVTGSTFEDLFEICDAPRALAAV